MVPCVLTASFLVNIVYVALYGEEADARIICPSASAQKAESAWPVIEQAHGARESLGSRIAA